MHSLKTNKLTDSNGTNALCRVETWSAQRAILTGRVQGVGLRPAVARWARAFGLTGCVQNTCRGVEVEIEGSAPAVDRFIDGLALQLPRVAHLESMRFEAIEPTYRSSFTIETANPEGTIAASVPVDLAVCAECLGDVASSSGRRRDYPLTSCAACGPRYSILQSMPYERAASSMSRYEMCRRCDDEYRSPSDRRFHAQTNACPKCGPRVWSADVSGRVLAADGAAIALAAEAIMDGRVVALRGVGGYQLLADATNDETIAELRRRKLRQGKPLAVLVDSLDAAERLAAFDDVERHAITDPANPIVVVRRRATQGLASAVHPGIGHVGLMLPTTALHWQIARACDRPLVATSGNREGNPLAIDVNDAQARLSEIAEVWLHHDRPIERPIDDSVVRIMAGNQVTIRLARGLAPLPLALKCDRHILALGGQQKAAVAVANGAQAVLGPHVGDLDGLNTRERFVTHLRQFTDLYGTDPELLVHDLHPDYFTSAWSARSTRRTLAVQHHHAHVAAGMLEHGWLNREVLGVAFDGTGYGTDGTIWGGEFLRANATDFERVACLRPFSLPGGEGAIKEPWRVALSLIAQAASPRVAAAWAAQIDRNVEAEQLLTVINHRRFSPVTTSAGRLFDGAAALILGVHSAQFEGQPAMLLEAACDSTDLGTYDLPLCAEAVPQLDWRPLVQSVLADRAKGVPPGEMAMRFHRGVAAGIDAVCRKHPHLPVVLGGGVFQNQVLVELLRERWSGRRQPLGLPGRIPPNDGGLAAGQLAVSAARISRG
jgi:hydrogenase maturation protein HypF